MCPRPPLPSLSVRVMLLKISAISGRPMLKNLQRHPSRDQMYVEIRIPKMMVWALDRWLGHKGVAFMIEISALIKETLERFLALSAIWGHSRKMSVIEPEMGHCQILLLTEMLFCGTWEYFFSCMISLARTSSKMLSRNGNRRHPSHPSHPSLLPREKAFSLLPLTTMLPVGFFDVLYQIEEVSLYS